MGVRTVKNADGRCERACTAETKTNRDMNTHETSASRPTFDGAESVEELQERLLALTSREREAARIAAVSALAVEAHAGQRRTGGNPYAVHPLRVAISLWRAVGEDGVGGLSRGALVSCGLAHDILEDAPEWGGRLRSLLTPRQTRVVELVSKTIDGEPTGGDYWAGISADPAARVVKVEDRIDNLRFGDLTKRTRQERYWEETRKHILPLALGTHAETELTAWSQTPDRLELVGRRWRDDGLCGG